MIGMITPLVKEATCFTKPLFALGRFCVGCVLGATSVGVLMTIPSWFLQTHLPRPAAAILLVVIGLTLASCDLGVAGAKTPSLKRQTCPLWPRRFGEKSAWVLWGFDLGLGISTIRVTSLYWMTLAMALLLAPAAMDPMILGSYGIAIAGTFAIATQVIYRSSPNTQVGLQTLAIAPALRRASGYSLAVVSSLLLLLQV
jgi:hypothetical protein